VNVAIQKIEQTSAGKKVTVEKQVRCHHRRYGGCAASYGSQKRMGKKEEPFCSLVVDEYTFKAGFQNPGFFLARK